MMSDISKNDVVGFAHQILTMQKRIDELERVNAALEKMAGGVKVAVEKLRVVFEEFRNSTFASGRSDENDQDVTGQCQICKVNRVLNHDGLCVDCYCKVRHWCQHCGHCYYKVEDGKK